MLEHTNYYNGPAEWVLRMAANMIRTIEGVRASYELNKKTGGGKILILADSSFALDRAKKVLAEDRILCSYRVE